MASAGSSTARRGENDEVDDEQRQPPNPARRLHHGDRPPHRRLAASGCRRPMPGTISTTIASWRRPPSAGCSTWSSSPTARPAGTATATPRSRSRVSHSAHFEPVTLWSALSQVTEQDRLRRHRVDDLRGPVSAGAQVRLARPHQQGPRGLERGDDRRRRVARTSRSPAIPAHANRYERAEEFVDLVLDLWDSLRGRRASSATRRAASSSTRPRSTRSTTRASSSTSPGRSMSRARRRAGRWWCRPAPPSRAATLRRARPR